MLLNDYVFEWGCLLCKITEFKQQITLH